MTTNVRLLPAFLLLAALVLPHTGAAGEEEAPSECRPYIEEALKGLKDPVDAEVLTGDEDRFTSQWDETKQETETSKEHDLTDETQTNEEQNKLESSETLKNVITEEAVTLSKEVSKEDETTGQVEGASREEIDTSTQRETETSVESQQEEEHHSIEVNEAISGESKEADDDSKTKSNESETEKEIERSSETKTPLENDISVEDAGTSEQTQEGTSLEETESREQSKGEISAHSEAVGEEISEEPVGEKEASNEGGGSMEESSTEDGATEGGEIISTEEVGNSEEEASVEEASSVKESLPEGQMPSSVEGAVSEKETVAGDEASIESSQNESSPTEGSYEEAPPSSGETPPTSDEAPHASDEAPQASDEAPHASDEAPQASDEAPQSSDEASHTSDEAPPISGEAPTTSDEVPHTSGETPPTSDESRSASSETTTASGETLHIDKTASTEHGSPVASNSSSQEELPSHQNIEEDHHDNAEQVTSPEEEDLTMNMEIPEKLRPRDHISEILRLDKDSAEIELYLSKSIDITLRDLKRLYETAIKPLEILYKYRDLSNRHFGDPEIFSKPLILFMGPWSGGKSTIINYLLDNEYKKSALRTGAEPSPAYFNIVMWGESEEVLDGTQLAADWTFSGLQKFGQGLLDRLRGLQLNHPLLEKVNIVEIPGILEIRKQVERLFPFNDACQWFIDRADIIFLVYDPSKLDVGPESEAILDQLKGREYQTRIILNKADQVKPEELMRVQGTLIWNISPLMSSTEPPVMYSTSLWSIPYESGAPTRLLFAQEKAFLRDLREAIDKRVENKIASARRFAVRVRNHAKMVDCYLTTYYNHKTFFGNKKIVSDDIIEHPQNYHIYEGLSTLTNISRYDLPDPEVYKDFFRLNPVYDFQQLSATCTYFRGCPINRLDVAIAYELPELVGKYKKSAEEVSKQFKKPESNS